MRLPVHSNRSLGNIRERGFLRVWDNGGRIIKLKKTEGVDKGPLSGDSRFNIEAHTVLKVSKVYLNS